jgi:chloramphenicol 3-O-phosphotransferase
VKLYLNITKNHHRSRPKNPQRLRIMASPRKAVVVGISGCSSSGKTTISRLLRDIFPNTFVLHEDDFYLPETE